MYKRHPQGWVKHIDFLLLDFAALMLSIFLTAMLKQRVFHPFPSILYRNVVIVMLPVHFMGALCMDNHKNILKRGHLREFYSVIQISVFDIMALAFYFIITQTGGEFSGPTFTSLFFITFVSLYAERIVWKKYIVQKRSRNPYFKDHLLIITHSLIAKSVIKRTIENSYGEYEIIGVFLVDNVDNNDAGFEKAILDIPIIRAAEGVVDYIHDKWIDNVLFLLPKEEDIPNYLLESCLEMGITVHISLDFLTVRSERCVVEKFAGCTVVTESLRIASPQQMFIKRTIDVCGALIGLAITAVLTLIFAPAIYLSDPGPIFFSQPRIGKNGRVFKLYKFRSMYQDAESRKKDYLEKNMMDGFMFKMENDPRILGSGPDGKRHGVGWLIRKYSIDEFPQFWNVLRGELSLVGTRPPLPEEWKQYESRHRVRMSIQPGITGLWQVSGRNKVRDFEQVIAMDREYIKNWSISEDIKIILKTISVIFSGDGK